MQSRLEPGKCPICGDVYYERLVLPDGTPVRQVGTSVLASDRNLTVDTNYRDSYVLLDDLSLTRVSYCKNHNPSTDDLLAIFQMTREYSVAELEAKGDALGALKWTNLNVVDTATTELEATTKLSTYREAQQNIIEP